MPKRGELKVHTCCICHKLLPYKPHRLVYQEYQEKRYNQYSVVCSYDFCNLCFRKYLRWIEKHKEEKE